MHYAPFYLMGRQLFLHHYLPAHLASSLVAGALLEFVFNVEPMELEEAAVAVSKSGKKTANPPQACSSTSESERSEPFGIVGRSWCHYDCCHWWLVLLPTIDVRISRIVS
jgi:hypothetical protein